jgi:hypothetical protein
MDVRWECRYFVHRCHVWLDCSNRPRLADFVTHLVLAVLWMDQRADGGYQQLLVYKCVASGVKG